MLHLSSTLLVPKSTLFLPDQYTITNSRDKLWQIADNLSEFGFSVPLVVTASDQGFRVEDSPVVRLACPPHFGFIPNSIETFIACNLLCENGLSVLRDGKGCPARKAFALIPCILSEEV